jgi:hypothetical protein
VAGAISSVPLFQVMRRQYRAGLQASLASHGLWEGGLEAGQSAHWTFQHQNTVLTRSRLGALAAAFSVTWAVPRARSLSPHSAPRLTATLTVLRAPIRLASRFRVPVLPHISLLAMKVRGWTRGNDRPAFLSSNKPSRPYYRHALYYMATTSMTRRSWTRSEWVAICPHVIARAVADSHNMPRAI